MPHNVEKQFLKVSIDLLNAQKRGLAKEVNEQLIELSKIIDKSAYLRENISPLDVKDAIFLLSWHRALRNVSDREFVEHLKSTILVTKTYHFYYPIYNLREPKNIVVGYSTILTFDDLPKKVQENFLFTWKNHFTINPEYAKTDEEFANRKRTATFLHLSVKANGSYKATEKAFNRAKDSVYILRFLYGVYFPINHCFYIIEDSEDSGGAGEYFYVPSLYIGKYQSKFDQKISELTDIMTKPKPTTIESKIKKSLRIFGIQTSITGEQVRFVLLITCLESLLLTRSDRDYILWRLAEKTAFLIGKNMKKVNDYVKLAYNKRSDFIHGKKNRKKYEITKADVYSMEGIVASIIHKLMEFIEQGYTEIKKVEGTKSVDGYIEEMKFRGNIN